MATHNTAQIVLPTSHVFFTVSRGSAHRTFMLRTNLLVLGAVLSLFLVAWTIGSTAYLAFHDQLVAAVMLRERNMQYDYEDRIASLRTQVDRVASKDLMMQRTVQTRLGELEARQAELQARSKLLSQLDQEVTGAVSLAEPTSKSLSQSAVNPSSTSQAPTETGRDPGTGAEDHASAQAISTKLSSLGAALDGIASSQDERLKRMNRAVSQTRDKVRAALSATGLSVDRVLATVPARPVGGPFVPLPDAVATDAFGTSSATLQSNVDEVQRLAAAIARVPLRKPLHGDPDVTSPFGARLDPFLGRPAMHTGVDLREDTGTDVYATAPGRVVSAGAASGYGLMVEIDHGGGLSTRYAHLSLVIARPGQVVKRGEIIGEVGATGRATGPHLHYETRIDGEPVDPIRFLSAGHALFGDRDS